MRSAAVTNLRKRFSNQTCWSCRLWVEWGKDSFKIRSDRWDDCQNLSQQIINLLIKPRKFSYFADFQPRYSQQNDVMNAKLENIFITFYSLDEPTKDKYNQWLWKLFSKHWNASVQCWYYFTENFVELRCFVRI